MIEAKKANFPVAMMCRCLEVTRSGFYAHRNPEPTERQKANEKLKTEIKLVHKESRGTYGSPRVHAELQEQGHKVGRNRIARLMAEEGVVGRREPKFRKTTDSAHGHPVLRPEPADAARRSFVHAC